MRTVLYVTHYSALFGANRALIEIVDAGRNLGIIPIVVTLIDGPLVVEMEKRNIPCYVVDGYPWTFKIGCCKYIRIVKQIRNFFSNNISSYRIVEICKKHKVDLVHTNSSVVSIGATAASILKIPHVWHIREFGDIDYSLDFYCGKSRAIDYIEKTSSKIIAISNTVYDYYVDYINDISKWLVIYDGVDEKNYLIKSINNKKKLSILFMGVMQESKNQMELLKALNLLYKEENKRDFEVYFLGGGNEDYINELKAYSNTNGFSNCIHFEGNVSDVRSYLSKCNIGVTASKKEAFGRVTIEYMYAGLCVLASNTGANLEIIDPNCAILYQYGDYVDMCRKLSLLYDDDELRHSIAVNGQRMALSKFTSEKNILNIMDVYKAL